MKLTILAITLAMACGCAFSGAGFGVEHISFAIGQAEAGCGDEDDAEWCVRGGAVSEQTAAAAAAIVADKEARRTAEIEAESGGVSNVD